MSKQSIEHVENLIRVVSNIPDNKFDLSHCHHCAMGHATRDEYFTSRGFEPGFPALEKIRDFFEIDMPRVSHLFFRHYGYESRMDVLAALRVLLLEKMAQEHSEEWAGTAPLDAPTNRELELAD